MGAELGTVTLRGDHQPRAVRCHGLETVAGWRLKTYGIAVQGEARPELLAAVRDLAAVTLPQPLQGQSRYGVGFVIAHDAADYCFALIDWWHGENEIHQRLFSAPLDQPEQLRSHPTEAIGCVWELAVVDFERRAWLRHVLTNQEGSDLDAYLAAHYEERF